MNSLETAYRALIEERCPNCRRSIEPSHARLSHDENQEYRTFYTCPHCETTTKYSIEIQPPIAHVSVRNMRGDRIKDIPKLIPRLSQERQDGKQEYEYIHYLDISLNIVYLNLNRLFLWGERFPDFFEEATGTKLADIDDRFENDLILNLGRDNAWIALHTDIHNYLASVFSHHWFIEDTISQIMKTDGDVHRLQTQYNAESKPLLGLRHYTQHRMIAPLHIQFNTGSADRVVDVLVDLDDLRDFDFRDGFDHWFGDVDGDFIDVIGQGIRHYQNAGKHAIERIETARGEHPQSFQKIEDLQDELPTLDELDKLDNLDVE